MPTNGRQKTSAYAGLECQNIEWHISKQVITLVFKSFISLRFKGSRAEGSQS
jgi:hypothetical protein